MTGRDHLPTMRRVKRKTAAWCSSLLIVVQMVMGPVAHPMSGFAGAADCVHAVVATAPHVDSDCGECPPAPDQPASGSQQDHSGTHGHYRCACPCGHTPALATVTFAVPKPVPPADIASEPKGPTFSPPLFDFLRPPN